MPDAELVGRERESDVVAGLLDDIDGRGAALVIEGVALARGMAVLSTTGMQSEAHLPFAGLHQLLRPILPGVDDLPVPQREAVRTAFGIVEGEAPEPFLIGLGALGLLSDAAASRPLLVSVEDAHWLDRASADALAFVARRVESDPIVVLVAIREGYESPLQGAGLAELHLRGLSDDAARELLDERCPGLSAAARGRVLAEAEGNPLGLLELAAAIGSEAPADIPLSSGLLLTVQLEQAFAARVAAAATVGSNSEVAQTFRPRDGGRCAGGPSPRRRPRSNAPLRSRVRALNEGGFSLTQQARRASSDASGR